MAHIPVMLEEVVEALALRDGEAVVDGTFGGGGYARAILAAADCHLLAIDRDPTAIRRAQALAAETGRLAPLAGPFGDMERLVSGAGHAQVDGVVLDLGVSSFQLDEADRGFSFMRDGPLDMRMGDDGPSAADAVNLLAEKDLAAVIFRLGEEPQSRRIARALVQRRAEARYERTLDLAETVETALGGRRGARTHPATRTFQALRMFVNDELGELARGLLAAERLLKAGGRLVVVTFHSLEDRMVKTFLRQRSGGMGAGSRHTPEKVDTDAPSFELPRRKATSVSEAEATRNPRARSARLRLGVRTNAPAWSDAPQTVFGLPALSAIGGAVA